MKSFVAAIIQARMGSTRYPEKVLRPLAGAPMIERLVERIRQIKQLNQIILAIPDNPADLPLDELGKNLGLRVVKGPEKDVLQRFLIAGNSVNADHILRITADNPLTDPELASAILDTHLNAKADYSFTSDPIPLGLSTEAVRLEILKKIARITGQKYYREHVTTYFHDHPESFRIRRVASPSYLIGKKFRLTVDTPEDFNLMERIYKNFSCPGKIIDLKKVIPFLEDHPEISHLNSHIRQKDWRQD